MSSTKRAGVCTIKNDEAAPMVSIGDVSITEGDSGTKNATFTVTLAPWTGQNAFFGYSTKDGTAQAGSDYSPRSDYLYFYTGDSVKTITVPRRHQRERRRRFDVGRLPFQLAVRSRRGVLGEAASGAVNANDLPGTR